MFKNKQFRKRVFLYFCYLLFGIKFVSAQAGQSISGTIISKDDGKPLPGVTINVENKGIGSITNAEGKFTIVLHRSDIRSDSLTFSCVGYRPEKISISSALSTQSLVIKLSESITSLSEVTVKPLTLKQLLDSIIHRNKLSIISPAILKGYYREFVYTNSKCTEYSDALWEYYLNLSTAQHGQLMINASRCLKEVKDNTDRHHVEVYSESRINPNLAFEYAMLTAMIEKYFPDKNLPKYSYDMEQSTDERSSDLKITISPKKEVQNEIYQLTLMLKNDYTLKSYHLEIPENLLAQVKGRSALGIHVKTTKFAIDVNYSSISGHIYPNYYFTIKTNHIWGKLLGVTVDQIVDNKSEFMATEVLANGVKPFEKQVIFKKGNICNNGIAINDTLLRNYTIIKPTQKDSISIKSLVNQ